MPRVPDPTAPALPCGHYTCSDRATEAGYFCRDHWFHLPEYIRAQVLLACDRHECCMVKGRPADKAFAVWLRSIRAAVAWLRCQDARDLPEDYQKAA